MRIGIFGIILTLIFLLLISACGGQATPHKIPDTQTPQSQSSVELDTPTPQPEISIASDTPLMDHPDALSIEFSESITERDQRLVNMAIAMAQSLFDAHGLSMYAEIYIAGDKDYFGKKSKIIFKDSDERSQKRYNSERGTTNMYFGQVLINIPLHDSLYEGDKRDNTFIFTIVHELHHLLQAKLSQGWTNVLPQPPWIAEVAANLGASRAIAMASCVSESKSPIASFQLASECPDKIIMENALYYYLQSYLEDPSDFNTIKLYTIAKFGLYSYDNYYLNLPDYAPASEEEYTQTSLEPWLLAFQETFDLSSIDNLIEKATAYIVENQKELFKAFIEKDGESSEK